MDTRSKLVSVETASGLHGPLALVAGRFDVLRAEDTRELNQAGRPLLVVVLRRPEGTLAASARAEMVAAIRVVDYVVTADHDALEGLIHRLQPATVVRLEAVHADRARRLMEDVQRSQTR